MELKSVSSLAFSYASAPFVQDTCCKDISIVRHELDVDLDAIDLEDIEGAE